MIARVGVLTAALVALVTGLAWAREGAREYERVRSTVGKSIEMVLREHTEQLLSLPGVVGMAVSECEGKPCIKVLVVKETPELVNKIPRTLEGYPVVIEETGEIRPLHPR